MKIENVAYDKHVQRCRSNDYRFDCRILNLEKIFISLERIARKNGYTFGYRFVLWSNQEMKWVWIYVDKLQRNMGLFVEFCQRPEYSSTLRIDFII